MAWSQILLNDVIFFIHDVKNDGTKKIPKTAFLIFLADNVGGDSHDDEPYVDLQSDIAFLTDNDRIGMEPFGGEPVGVAAVKFIETPGNQVDGIDNDGDADDHPELIAMMNGDPDVRIPHFSDDDFSSRTLKPGDKIVLIDFRTYDRYIVNYPDSGGTIKTMGQSIHLPSEGISLVEDTTANGLDDDLDGLIDERYTIHRWRYNEITKTESPVRFINYLSFEPGDTVKCGFTTAGKAVQRSYASVAPMIDESRDDGFDNDGDWDAFNDDLGLDGVNGTGDPGEGDNLPSSGAGTEFPGEPNIDKTDVSETDLIGLTSAIQIPEASLNLSISPDKYYWDFFMTPGRFSLPRPTGGYDTFVASGFFPMDPGERQRMAVALAIAGGGQTKSDDIRSVTDKLEEARKAYEADYQFARAPTQVTVKAVSGDGQVTLYWDDLAEYSIDRYIGSIGGTPNDFEGYRIYRATDAAFLDAKVISDGFGVPSILKPIAQFDLKDGIIGFDPVGHNGIHFYLGDDRGIVHTFTDRDIINGQKYYYAVTAYDFGFPPVGIAPAETPIAIDIDFRGNMKMGSNVAVVRPKAPSAGYLPPEVEQLNHVQGSATGEILISIIDPANVQNGHEYEIVFQDTVIKSKDTDILTTKNFTLKNITEDKIIIDHSQRLNIGDEIPVTEGFQLTMINEKLVEIDQVQSGWNRDEIFPFDFIPVIFVGVRGEKRPNDYMVIIDEPGITTSIDTSIGFYSLHSKSVNFKVINSAIKDPVIFAFAELDGSDGRFTINPSNSSSSDIIYLLEPNDQDKLVYTWQISLKPKPNGENPQQGDTLRIQLRKPFLSQDVFHFKMKGHSVLKDLARKELEDIRVVPNPYIATVSWEPKNTYNTGRGPREIHFINLPSKCTIRIYDVNGTLVDKIEHDTVIDNGTEVWDVLSREKLDISYGLYLYHIDAPDIGQKTGTFAIIK